MNRAHTERDDLFGKEAMGGVLRVLFPTAVIAMVVVATHNGIAGNWKVSLSMAAGAVGAVAFAIVSRTGRPQEAVVGLALVMLGALTGAIAWSRDGTHDVAMAGYVAILLVAGLVVNLNAFLAITGLTLICALGLVVGEVEGLIFNRISVFTDYRDTIDVVVVLVAMAVLSRFLWSTLAGSLARERRIARMDSLTGIANRRHFREQVEAKLGEIRARGGEAALILADMDRFSRINEAQGHLVGDAILREVARRMEEAVGEGAIVGRQGDDQYVAAITGAGAADRGAGLMERLAASLARPYSVDSREFVLTASGGMAAYPADASDFETLLYHAELALRAGRRRPGGRWLRYEPEMSEHNTRILRVETELRSALAKNGFFLQYQPIISARSRELASFEALVRLRSASGEEWAPGRFVSVAEETGLILALGDWILDNVGAQLKEWNGRSLTPVPVAINVSARQVLSGMLSDSLRGVLERHAVDPGLVTLELTESSLMDVGHDPVAEMRALKDLGVRIAIDDFGTGYSSLSYLQKFPIDCIKIDRAFVRGVPANATSVALFKAILEIANALGLQVVAEGVESEEQLEFIASLGCPLLQGFAIARPMDTETAASALVSRLRG
jgi:diguanylate cyclase (GGDEF)-like protein